MNKAIDYGKTCSECGAPEAYGPTCREQFMEVLAWEQDDPSLLNEHFWTVACYKIQHPAHFTADSMANFHQLYKEAYDRKLPIGEIRKRVSAETQGTSRVIRDIPTDPVFRDWAMTISEVYLAGEQKGAADRVRAWAKVVRKQM